MIFRFLLVASLIYRVNGQTVCEICGPGLIVTNPDFVIDIPGQAIMPTCSQLEDAGLNGGIPDGQCTLATEFIFNICGCAPATPTLTAAPTPAPSPLQSTPAPTSPPTVAPIEIPTDSPTPTPVIIPGTTTNPPCEVCGEGLFVTQFDALVTFPGLTTTPTCRRFEEAGKAGQIPESQCNISPIIISSTCGCAPLGIPSFSSSPTLSPTSSTVTSPTSTPVLPPNTTGIPCYLCGGEEYNITLPDATLDITDQPITCQEVNERALNGEIPENQCPLLPLLASRPCGCAIKAEPTPTVAPISQPTAPSTAKPDACNVCGEGYSVGNRGAPLSLISGRSVTCGELEDLGLAGNIALGDCFVIPQVIFEQCFCKEIETQSPGPGPSDPLEVCNICGEGMQVTIPGGLIEVPGGNPFSCQELEILGNGGQILPADCLVVPDLIHDICGCAPCPNGLCHHEDNLLEHNVTVPPATFLIPGGPPTPSPSLLNSTTSAPTLLPGTIATQPTEAPASTCNPDQKGGFGDNSGTPTVVDYLYEVITTPLTLASALQSILSSALQPAISASLLSTLFSQLCPNPSQRNLLQHRSRRLNVVGLSAEPQDELVQGVSCVFASSPNGCTVVQGYLTLYSEPGTDVAIQVAQTRAQIQSNMDSGAFDNLDTRLVAVRYRTDPITTDPSPPSDPPSQQQGEAVKSASADSLPWWVWVVIGVGVLLINVMICLYCARRRNNQLPRTSAKNDTVDPYLQDDGPYQNGGSYNFQQGGLLVDDSEDQLPQQQRRTSSNQGNMQQPQQERRTSRSQGNVVVPIGTGRTTTESGFSDV